MTKVKILGSALGLLAILLSVTGCDITPGGSCSQVGSQHTNSDGVVYTCKVNTQTGKNYWYH